ncbi:MAG: hypothetical protein ACRCTI_21865 [Beijerinckiaceae bacterium]
MRLAVAASAVAAFLLGGCVERREIAPGVVAATAGEAARPGTVRFGLANVDREKWTPTVAQGAQDGSVRYGFTCKVLTCPEPAVVILTTRRSPTERPDPKALEKIARESIPKLTQAENLQLQVRTDNKARTETLSSAVTRIRDYPALYSETKLTALDRSRYTTIATVFAGKLLITIRAEAGDRVTAKSAVDEVARAFTIEEGPAPDSQP